MNIDEPVDLSANKTHQAGEAHTFDPFDRIHPVCAFFPEMTSKDYAELKDSIFIHGQTEPIVHDAKMLLDGRHRLRACRELNIQPKFIEFSQLGVKMDPAAWIMTVNALRRHLTDDQRLAITAKHLAWTKLQKPQPDALQNGARDQGTAVINPVDPSRGIAQTEQRSHTQLLPRNQDQNAGDTPKRRGRPPGKGNGREAERVARATGQSRYKAEHMSILQKQSPDLAEAVRDGSMTLKKAWAAHKQRHQPVVTASESQDIEGMKNQSSLGNGDNTTAPTSENSPAPQTTMASPAKDQRIMTGADTIKQDKDALASLLERLRDKCICERHSAPEAVDEIRRLVEYEISQFEDLLESLGDNGVAIPSTPICKVGGGTSVSRCREAQLAASANRISRKLHKEFTRHDEPAWRNNLLRTMTRILKDIAADRSASPLVKL